MGKLSELKRQLLNYQKKLKQLVGNFTETKTGSRYGNEYLEIQIKVYQDMITSVQKEIKELTDKKS